MIEITARAAEALKAAMARTNDQAAGVRITASKEGCTAVTYAMGLVSGGLEDDQELLTPSGITVFASRDSVPHLIGCVLDYGETDNGLAFAFFNPNAVNAAPSASSHGCSCGKSACSTPVN